jgi:hypothetical protein
MASVLEREAPAGAPRRSPHLVELANRARGEGGAAARGAPDVIELANRARLESARGAPTVPGRHEASGVIGYQTPHQMVLAPGRAVPGPPGPPPGVWRAPPPPAPGWYSPRAAPPAPPAPPPDRSSWPGAKAMPGERDTAQRVGDALYPFVEWLRESRGGWFAVAALFGITVPIILLRQGFGVRSRLTLSFIVAFVWLQLLQELFGG